MIINKKTVTLASITLTILLFLSLLLSPTISFAANGDKTESTKTQEIEEQEHSTLDSTENQKDTAKKEPSRSGSAPHLRSNVTTSYTAYGIVNEEFGFSDNWLEYYFEDPENDTLSFYASINNGAQSQSYFTVLTDENNNDVTTFTYTPASAGTYDIKIYANDGSSTSTDYLNITLNVESANNSNYCYVNINTASNVTNFAIKDALGQKVTINRPSDSGTVKTYTTTLAKGRYTFEGTPSGGNQASGMAFTVPATAGAGTSANPDVINIKQVNVTVSAGSTLNGSQYDLHLVNAAGTDVTPGVSTSTLSNYTTIPLLVLANGNAELYNYIVEPGTFTNSSNYAAYYEGNVTFTGTGTVTKAITLPTAINYTFSVPTGATMQVFKQLRNYQTAEVAAVGNPTTSGNYDTYTYKLPQNGSSYTYRVSKSGKITRAGFLSLSAADSKTIDLSNDSPSLTLAHATASPSQEANNIFNMTAGYDENKTVGSRAEDSVLLNAHTGSSGSYSALYHNYINLNIGSSYKIRGYRAAWQIINSDTANIMIEPDFHFQVVEGTASDLTLTQDSVHNSWCTVTPNTGASGVYVIKVTYDAIDVDGMSYSNNPAQRFYATAAGREGYLVINVDSSKYADMAINAEASGSRDANMDWDSEIDTVYYTGTQGTFTFAPTISGKTISTVQFSTTPGTYNTITPNNGKYTVHPVQGYNMIKVTCSDNTVAYAPIRAAKIKILVDGNDLANNPTVNANVNHYIKLEGVYMPVPKFSGIYNPMMNKANYTVGNSTVSGNNVQYNFISQNKITWKPTSTGTYNFTNGYHSMRMFCNTTAKWGHHRLLTDVGVGANFSAGLVNGVFNIYPDFSIVVS